MKLQLDNNPIKKLYSYAGIKSIHNDFLKWIKKFNFNLAKKIEKCEELSDSELKEAAIFVGEYLACLFEIGKNEKFIAVFDKYQKIKKAKKVFVNKYIKNANFEILNNIKFEDVENEVKNILHISKSESIDVHALVDKILDCIEVNDVKSLETIKIFGMFILTNDLLKLNNLDLLFFKAKKTDFENLFDDNIKNNVYKRNSFDLYQKINHLEEAMFESDYCSFCKTRKKDSCRNGLFEEQQIKKNPLGINLNGCPLKMDISLMHELFDEGFLIPALVVITINNPLALVTGYKICVDCKVSCVYQKQQVVDTPKVETAILLEVLKLKYGVEIYSLLTRWNPLRLEMQFLAKKNYEKVMVVGAGPSGFSLAYNLINRGYFVWLVDSAKIEPLDDKFVDKNFQLIKNANDVFEKLEDRVCYGFGGVIEFGITSRYDKNLLTILRIILERNNNLLISGGVFFGANFNFIDAKNLGFSHVAICSGSGKSKIPENLSYILKYKGVKFISEFLMNINLGATKKHSLSNMLIRMPIAVLGGGLSAIDGAMESFLYYKKQITKYVENLDKINYESFLKNLNNEEVEIHNEFLNHHAILQKMKNNNDKEIMEEMGGVSVFYYKNYTSSNSYKINIEEVNLAKNYGITLYYNNLFKDIEIDENNYIKNIITKNLVTNLEEKYSIKSLMIAFGYKKNRFIFKNENENLFVFENDDIKIENFLVKTTEEYNKKYGDMEISVLGDSNPKYEGSVVLAMASGFLAYKKIFNKRKKLNKDSFSYTVFKNKLINKFKAKLKYIKKIDNYYEICIESKQFLQQALNIKFVKIQNYIKKNNKLNYLIEPIALSLVKIKNKLGFFYLKIVGQSTKYFIENIKEGAEIFLVTNLGKNIEFKQKDKILFITSGIQNSKVINIAEIAKRYELEVYSIMIKEDDDDFIKINLGLKSLMVFDKNELNLCYEKIFEIYTHNKINKVFFYTGLDLLKEIIDYLKNKKITNFENFISGVNCVMQCMNFGICSTCVRIYFDGKVINTCEKNYDKVEYIDIDNIKNRNGQSSLLEKIANMVDLG